MQILNFYTIISTMGPETLHFTKFPGDADAAHL